MSPARSNKAKETVEETPTTAVDETPEAGPDEAPLAAGPSETKRQALIEDRVAEEERKADGYELPDAPEPIHARPEAESQARRPYFGA